MIPHYLLQKTNIPPDLIKADAVRRTEQSDWYETFPRIVDGLSEIIIWDSKGTENIQLALMNTNDPEYVSIYNKAFLIKDYFSNILGRNGITGRGTSININVNFGKNYPNALWYKDQLILGTGDKTIFKNFSQSLDVIAHEFSHGVIQNTANFLYKYESGALSEHFADVFASTSQLYALRISKDTYDWTIGNEIMVEKGDVLRSMRAPGTAYSNKWLGVDQQMPHYSNRYQGSFDNGGVHLNSGIMNRLFFLVATNTNIDTAATIWYWTLKNLLSVATFQDAAEELIRVSKDVGKSGDTQLVRWAINEVGL